MDKNFLAHTGWDRKYRIVFTANYRRQIIDRKIKQDIGQILRTLCDRKGITTAVAEACPDHVHMLVEIPPKYNVSD
jgi:putative transposase